MTRPIATLAALLCTLLLAGCTPTRPGPVITLPAIAPTATTQPFPTPDRPTATVTPTAAVTAYAAATVTPTPAVTQRSASPTRTRRPPPTATPVPLVRDTGRLPPIPHDLLFLEERHLWRWNHLTGQIELVAPGPITDFAVAANAPHVLYIRGFESRQELYWQALHPTFQQPESAAILVAQEKHFRNIAIAPDGSRVAYVREDSYYSGTIFAGTVEDGVAAVAPCAEVDHPDGTVGCGVLFWGNAPDRVLFTDGNGLWQLDLTTGDRELWLTVLAEGVNRWRTYRPLHWSPSGTFLLLREHGYEGTIQVIYDPARGVLERIPDVGTYGEFPQPTVTWLSEERLVVLYSQSYEDLPATAPGRIWQANREGELLTLRHEFDQPFDNYIFLAPVPKPAEATTLLLGIADFAGRDLVQPRLVALDWRAASTRTVRDYVGLPGDFFLERFQRGIWAPDGSVALMRFDIEWSGETRPEQYLLYADGRPAVGVELLENACCFRWVAGADYSGE